ncbi:hypothetical protein Agabi119p4_5903 [Agaricus bisporus var. burnettii]|uniref:Small RNA 2'-O-methyltransferase n=1 Tax=Agaricus bisporus var. burnettii TaxID=192524 RepID=A0A8H7F0U4_AGABI|nr:hypothetical protein Agabi119p4_5903 [Agaricus bisporus var. burnettii]
MDIIPEDGYDQELKVTFQPELYLQRRIWILDLLRKESITQVLDVGCGEGQLLSPLSQAASWLSPPPPSILPPKNSEPGYTGNPIPNLHISHLHGLDISQPDLEFAARSTAPSSDDIPLSQFHIHHNRWEELEVKLWQGGLEVINEEFVNIECIVSMEVIEHLPPEIVPAFAPLLLGVYHPEFLLITTPSYTYNSRFTAPNAPTSARQGFVDPTGRTDRIFRHDDHQFEWTFEEFREWCDETAKEWGYAVEVSGVGRAVQPDPWGREKELGYATSVACFKKNNTMQDCERGRRGREVVTELALPSKEHELFSKHIHRSHPSSQKPKSLVEVAEAVVEKMDHFHETFMRVEELWFEPEISVACGGWIELLIRAAEESESLSVMRDGGIGNDEKIWMIQRLGGPTNLVPPWSANSESSLDYIPPEWEPEGRVFEDSARADGEFSWNNSELETGNEWSENNNWGSSNEAGGADWRD